MAPPAMWAQISPELQARICDFRTHEEDLLSLGDPGEMPTCGVSEEEEGKVEGIPKERKEKGRKWVTRAESSGL